MCSHTHTRCPNGTRGIRTGSHHSAGTGRSPPSATPPLQEGLGCRASSQLCTQRLPAALCLLKSSLPLENKHLRMPPTHPNQPVLHTSCHPPMFLALTAPPACRHPCAWGSPSPTAALLTSPPALLQHPGHLGQFHSREPGLLLSALISSEACLHAAIYAHRVMHRSGKAAPRVAYPSAGGHMSPACMEQINYSPPELAAMNGGCKAPLRPPETLGMPPCKYSMHAFHAHGTDLQPPSSNLHSHLQLNNSTNTLLTCMDRVN